MQLMTVLHTPNDSCTANDASFYKNKFDVFLITVDAMNTCMVILQLIRSTTVLLDKLREYACAGTLQQVCCQAAHKRNINKQELNFFCKN